MATALRRVAAGARVRMVALGDQVGVNDGVGGVMVRAARVAAVDIGSEKVSVMAGRVGWTSSVALAGETETRVGGVASRVVKAVEKGAERGFGEEAASVAVVASETTYVVGTALRRGAIGVRVRMVALGDQIGVKDGVGGVMVRAARVAAVDIGSEKVSVMAGRVGWTSVVALAGETETRVGGVASRVVNEVEKGAERGFGEEAASVAVVASETTYVVGTALRRAAAGARVRMVALGDQVGVKDGVGGVMVRAARVAAVDIGSEKVSVMAGRMGWTSSVALAGAMEERVGGGEG